MRRIHLIVEYDGTGYAGWQRQANALAVLLAAVILFNHFKVF